MRATLGEGFNCECGEHHDFGAWVAAHWDEELIHTCNNCGRSHTLHKGHITLNGKPKLKVKKGNGR